MMRSVIFLMLLALGLTACKDYKKNNFAFDGVYFKSKSKTLGDNLADFTVRVDGVSQSLDGARQAGGYEGTKYCIKNYGTSDIKWVVGPETDPAALTIEKDGFTFQGRCEP